MRLFLRAETLITRSFSIVESEVLLLASLSSDRQFVLVNTYGVIKMKCKLTKYINHSEIREQFRQTYIQCPLLAKQDIGMASLGVICGHCCIRLSQLIAVKKDLLLRSIISAEDYRRNPDVIKEYLPEHLLSYYLALKKLGKTIKDASSECNRCGAEPLGSKPIYADESMEMTQCKRGDFS